MLILLVLAATVCYGCSTYYNQDKGPPTDRESGGLTGESIGKEKQGKNYFMGTLPLTEVEAKAVLWLGATPASPHKARHLW